MGKCQYLQRFGKTWGVYFPVSLLQNWSDPVCGQTLHDYILRFTANVFQRHWSCSGSYITFQTTRRVRTILHGHKFSSKVCDLMHFQMTSSVKWFPTDLTTIRFLSSMNSLMYSQLGREMENLCTKPAYVFFVTLLDGLFQYRWKINITNK